LLALGMRDFYPLMALALAGFVTGTVVQEFTRGVRARMRMYAESSVVALAHLVGRNRRRYGGYIVHIGIVVYFVAFTGLAFKVKTTAELLPGQSTTIHSPFGYDYTLTHLGVSQYSALNRRVSAATLQVSRDGKPLGTITSEKRQHVDSFGNPTFEPSTEVGIRSDLREDLYVVYAGSPDGTERANFTILVNPLVMWFWIGCGILTFGGLITMWPGGAQVRTVRRRAVPQAGYAVPLAGVGE
ncbi:MAG: cytochrome c-type biogenesis CcmF C-terminal domain-containing protein, partial [Gemmatimonadota bacterium]